MTTAERIEQEFCLDEWHHWRADGAILQDACASAAIWTRRDHQRDRVRWQFPDGSAIVAEGDAWDLGFPAPARCFCAARLGHDALCAVGPLAGRAVRPGRMCLGRAGARRQARYGAGRYGNGPQRGEPPLAECIRAARKRRKTMDTRICDGCDETVTPDDGEHTCESVLTPDGHGAFCRFCGETVA